MESIYVASCVPDGGIYRLECNASGKLEEQSFVPVPSPGYLALSQTKLFAVLAGPVEGSENGAVLLFHKKENGDLVQEGGMWSTGGKASCHITPAAQEDAVYCANYTSGSVARLSSDALRLSVHKGHSIHPQRQASPHVHQVVLTPDKRWVCATDLGLDAIYLYTPDLSFHAKVAMEPGSGPRHLVFEPGGRYAYCLNELQSTVTVLSYDGESLYRLSSVSALPESAQDCASQAAAVRMTKDGKWLLTSNRGHDSITCFRAEGPNLQRSQVISCAGLWPRDFIFSKEETHLFCANERSDDISVFAFDNGVISGPLDRFRIKRPMALVTGT